MLKKAVSFYCLLVLIISCFFSCTPQSGANNTGPDKYSFYILAKNGEDYIVKTDSLNKGIIYPEKQGALLNDKEFDRDVIVKDNFYYRIDRRTPYFSKYKVDQNSYKKVDSIPTKDFSIENYCWAGKDTLLLTGLVKPAFARAKYILLKTDKLAVIAQGDIDIPAPKGRFSSMSIGFTERRGQQLLMGYTYHQQLGLSNYTTSDTMYITSLTYPHMKAIKTDKDTRSTYPGGINTVQHFTFYDEAGNFYYLTCPGIALGNRPDLPTGIFRIKKGESASDKNYFFNISATVHNHGYGMWYLGNNKAIVRCERKDLFKGLSDHYSAAHFEFYVINLLTQKAEKLPLPLDKGTRRECIIVDKGIAYIATNSTKEGNYVWMYNIEKGTLKKGLQLAGETDFILRMDKLN